MQSQALRHYRILEQVGEGGMGRVFKAWDTHLDRHVAIKMLRADRTSDPDRRRRFIQEAKTASALNHGNIVTIHDIIEEDGLEYIVMEFVEGKTLRAMIPAGGMPVDDVGRVGMQIADALATAHAAGVIHRDLKPANILVTPQRRVKVVDFGLAKLTESLPVDGSTTVTVDQTAAGVLLGTVGYLSPEQLEGRPLDARSDLFALGIVLYEMLTGKRPFSGSTSLAMMASVLGHQPTPISTLRADVPADLEVLVGACLQKDPRRRIQRAAELRDALSSLIRQPRESSLSRDSSWLAIEPPDVAAIAVLPFANQTADRENDYFSDGLAEDILNALTKFPKLRVTARASAFAFRGPNYSLAEIAEKLRVDYVLDGGVRRAQNRLRVTVNLIHVSDGLQMWSERFDREMTDIFEIQDEISAAVVEKLRGQLSGRVTTHAPRPHKDLEAYKLYLKGRFQLNRRSAPNLLHSLECFEEALRIDPSYVEAYTGIADAYNLLGYYNQRPPRQAYPFAGNAVKRALEIDREHGGAHASLGYTTLFYGWDWNAADREFRRAIELDPENARAHHWHAWHFFATGQFLEGIAAMKRAHDRDPLAPIVNDHLGLSYSLAGSHDEGLQKVQAAIDIDPSFSLAHYRRGWIYLQKNEPENAIEPLERAVALSERKYGVGLLAMANGLAGRVDEARQAAAVLEEMAATQYTSPLETSLVWAGLGDADRAFSELDRAVDERVSDLVLFLSYPWPDQVRQDARFHGVAKRIGLTP